jgi:pimeloyl-ACP methyl ester carboxylesterase
VRVVSGDGGARFAVGPSNNDGELVLAASLLAKPGKYGIEVSATGEDGREETVAAQVVLSPIQTVPTGSTIPPLVLVNGFQAFSCPDSGTFGHLAEGLMAANDIPAVYFFDYCVEGLTSSVEDLGQALGQVLDLIQYDSGELVPQVDLVTHSMGGLISRAYLSGLRSDGTFSTRTNPRVRKLVEIATPNFGSFIAADLSSVTQLWAQAPEMIPGSMFLWRLATWNQGGDDLRGVDALAIIGNAGSFGAASNASDGVVSLTSASLLFSRDPSRTRILPYCHLDSGWYASTLIGVAGGLTCSGWGIANPDNAWETGFIVSSFLAGTSDWAGFGNYARPRPVPLPLRWHVLLSHQCRVAVPQ